MRVLQVGKYYFPEHGGIETVIRNLSEGLVQAGHEVTVLCSSVGASSAEEWIAGVRVVRVPMFGKILSQPISPSLPVQLHRLAKNYDVIHFHTPNPLSESAALTLPPSSPLVVSYHSDIVRQKWVIPVYQPILMRFLNRMRKIAVATKNHITHSPFLNPFESKCAVIPFGINPSEFERTPAIDDQVKELRQEHGRYVLFVGRLVGYKGLSVLLDAMPSVDARLLVVGCGPLQSELQEQAKRLGVSDKVRFLGEIQKSKDLCALYHGCEALILPSITRAEAFGMVQVEAMACAKPTVFTKLDSGVTEVNQNGVTGVQVPPGEAAPLAEAIEQLLKNEAQRKEMGWAARRRFEKLFTTEKMVRSYQDLYQSL